MGTFPPNPNDAEDEVMMVCDGDSASPNGHASSSFFEQRNGLGNDYCPHSSQLFPLMEGDVEIPLVPSTLRKQTAVTCLTALAEEEFEGSSSSAHDDFLRSSRAAVSSSAGSGIVVFGSSTLVAEANPDDEWGQFAHHHEAQFARSTSRRVRLHAQQRPRRRRSPAKYDRHGSSLLASNAWRG